MKKDEKKFKNAQNLIEYILIGSIVALACATIIMMTDYSKLKNYVLSRPGIKDASGKNIIEVEPMTKGP